MNAAVTKSLLVGVEMSTQQIELLENFKNSGYLREFLAKALKLAAYLEKGK